MAARTIKFLQPSQVWSDLAPIASEPPQANRRAARRDRGTVSGLFHPAAVDCPLGERDRRLR
jgi:hypothetical protein